MGKALDARMAERAVLSRSVPAFGIVIENDDGSISKVNKLVMEYSLKDANGIEIAIRKIEHQFPHIENELPSDTSQRITDNVMTWYAEDHIQLTNNQLGG